MTPVTKRIPLCYILLFACSMRAVALDYCKVGQDAYEYAHLSWTNSYITFLMDPYDNKYVVKQLKNNKKICWAKIICEAVALEVGHSIGIPQNHVCIIPAGIEFIGKEVTVPATLHTFVPGIRVDELPEDVFPNLSIKQRDGQGKRIGLTRDLIYQMSRHKDFPAMVAYDTFVSNPARHRHNFFYDESNDTFYSIDMGASFYGDLCTPSLKTIQKLMQDENNRFNRAEYEALLVYCQTLKKLVKLYNSIDLCNKLDEYARYAGIFNSMYFGKKVQERCFDYLTRCKKMIDKSYPRAIELINALEQLLAI